MLPALFAGQMAMNYLQQRQQEQEARKRAAAQMRQRSAQQLGAPTANVDAAEFNRDQRQKNDRDRTQMFNQLFGYLNSPGGQ
jgi:hypothetical protein